MVYITEIFISFVAEVKWSPVRVNYKAKVTVLFTLDNITSSG